MNAPINGQFSLIDHNGNPVSERNFRGRYMLVYFGFTHCRIVCPRSLGKLSNILDRLGDRAANVAALYISVDPARDTPERMKAYLDENFPRFLGLTGETKAIDDAKRAFRIFAKQQPDAEDPDGYAVPHTAIAYLIDPNGQYRAHFTDALDADAVERRLAEIFAEATDAFPNP